MARVRVSQIRKSATPLVPQWHAILVSSPCFMVVNLAVKFVCAEVKKKKKRKTFRSPNGHNPGFIIYEIAECEKNKNTLYFYNVAVDKCSKHFSDSGSH
jgi:hypothetical protein